jgi:hypothetical protein
MPGTPREIGCNFFIIRPFPGDLTISHHRKLAKRANFEQTVGMSLVRTMYALMAARKPVTLTDGRTGVITRVDTSFPEEETTVHVWMKSKDGPGLAKVNAKMVTQASPEKKKKKTG